MREIKFRAWDHQNKRMIDGFHAMSPRMSMFITQYSIEHKQYAVMQFTGLTDKNEKECYEGDIVTLTLQRIIGEPVEVIAVVQWNDNGWWEFDVPSEGQSVVVHILEDEDSEFEIIGNVHENPELLKETYGLDTQNVA